MLCVWGFLPSFIPASRVVPSQWASFWGPQGFGIFFRKALNKSEEVIEMQLLIHIESNIILAFCIRGGSGGLVRLSGNYKDEGAAAASSTSAAFLNIPRMCFTWGAAQRWTEWRMREVVADIIPSLVSSRICIRTNVLGYYNVLWYSIHTKLVSNHRFNYTSHTWCTRVYMANWYHLYWYIVP